MLEDPGCKNFYQASQAGVYSFSPTANTILNMGGLPGGWNEAKAAKTETYGRGS
jgi:hypothetical protein